MVAADSLVVGQVTPQVDKQLGHIAGVFLPQRSSLDVASSYTAVQPLQVVAWASVRRWSDVGAPLHNHALASIPGTGGWETVPQKYGAGDNNISVLHLSACCVHIVYMVLWYRPNAITAFSSETDSASNQTGRALGPGA